VRAWSAFLSGQRHEHAGEREVLVGPQLGHRVDTEGLLENRVVLAAQTGER
jgi:hypothetical protein